MRMRLILAALLALGAAPLAQAEDGVQFATRAQYETRGANPANPYRVRDWEHGLAAADLRWQWDAPRQTAVKGLVTARDASDEDGRVTLNELSFERAAGSGFVTFGKKIMSWDVGYAFRPLDVVQQEDRRALNVTNLVGVPLLAYERFTAGSALTFVWSNPGRGKADQPRGDESLALRWYASGDARDRYAVLRVSHRNGIEGGVSFSQVHGDGLELHGSVLFQQRHDTWNGPRWEQHGSGGKALAGLTWTTESKWMMVAEAWADRTALKGQQHNVLLREEWRDGDLAIGGDVLWQTQNGSRIASASVAWTPAPWLLSASVRRYGGVAGTVVRSAAVFTVQRAF